MTINLQSLLPTAAGIPVERVFLTSTTFTIPKTNTYLITAIGAGGSGAQAPSSGNGMAATGGAAGGFAQKAIKLSAGTTLTITIGAGGVSQVTAATNGSAGGTTTVVGAGVSLTANGGGGGLTQAAGAATISGAVGGTATGGDINIQGGGSGTATVTATIATIALTGGGAVGVYGVGYPSGNASSSAAVAYTGGAGTGGKSGNATSSTADAITAGGSSVSESGPAINANTTSTGGAVSILGVTGDAGLVKRVLSPTGSSSTNALRFTGGGGPGTTSGSTLGGIFAGGGAGAGQGGGGLGAGGGAKMGVASGAGGNGCVVIEWAEGLN